MRVFNSFYTFAGGWHTALPTDMDSTQTLVLIFSAPDIDRYQPALNEIYALFPQAIITGCSAFASIFQDQTLDDGLVINILQFQQVKLKCAFADLNDFSNTFQAGRSIGQALAASDLQAVIVLADGVHVQGTALAHSMSEELDERVTIVGGLASDKATFRHNWLLKEGKAVPQNICGIGLYGKQAHVLTCAKDGWHPFGPERTVTRAHDNRLYELDGYPALALYQEYLGKRAKDLPHSALHFPLAVWHHQRKHYIIRAVVEINETDNSLRCAGDITTGSRAQLMYAYPESLIEGAEEAALQICQRLPRDSSCYFSLAISCYGRKVIMGEDTDQELEAILEHLPAGCVQSGFYSYGEFAPNQELNSCCLYNETMTLTVIYEETQHS